MNSIIGIVFVAIFAAIASLASSSSSSIKAATYEDVYREHEQLLRDQYQLLNGFHDINAIVKYFNCIQQVCSEVTSDKFLNGIWIPYGTKLKKAVQTYQACQELTDEDALDDCLTDNAAAASQIVYDFWDELKKDGHVDIRDKIQGRIVKECNTKK